MDLSLKCSKCKNTVPVYSFGDHQNKHNALRVLKFKGITKGPVTVDVLLKRRRLIIKKMLARFKDKPHDPELFRRIDKINESFEVIRCDLLRGKSLCNCLTPLIVKSTVKEGGMKAEEDDIFNDVKSNAVTDASTNALPDCILAIGTCQAVNIEARCLMEDRTLVLCRFSSIDKKAQDPNSSCFVGVYDGYGGVVAAEQSHRHFHQLLDQELAKCRESSEDLDITWPSKSLAQNQASGDQLTEQLHRGMWLSEDEERSSDPNEQKNAGSATLPVSPCSNLISHREVLRSFHRAYKRMDERLAYGIDESSWVRWSGCSAATCVVTDEQLTPAQSNPNGGFGDGLSQDGATELRKPQSTNGRIFFANTGDVEAYLCHKNKYYSLSSRHTPEEERDRVVEAGGEVLRSGRSLTVNSVLHTSRGLGNHGDPALRRCVISDPHTATARITSGSQFVVVATASVWAALGVEEVMFLVKNTSVADQAGRFPMPMTMLYKHRQSGDSRMADSSDEDAPSSVDDQHVSKLASIVETDEELCDEIEEVVIVKGADDDDSSSFVSQSGEAVRCAEIEEPSAPMTESERIKLNEAELQARKRTGRGRLAQAMSERIVRAALATGPTENLSAVVILFAGFEA